MTVLRNMFGKRSLALAAFLIQTRLIFGDNDDIALQVNITIEHIVYQYHNLDSFRLFHPPEREEM